MKFPFSRFLGISLTVAVSTTGYAAEDDDIPIEYLRPLNNSISIGMHTRSQGPKVKFGMLGDVFSSNVGPGDTSTKGTRVYSNGTVVLDAQRGNEFDANGVALPVTVDGRYRIMDSTDTTKVIADFIAYRADQTRQWEAASSSQYNSATKEVRMNIYNATSDGAAVEVEGGSEGGFELQFERTLGKIGKRFEWGVVASVGLTDVSVKTSSSIRSSLRTFTDYYTVLTPDAQLPAAFPAFGPTFRTLFAADGTTVVTENGFEDTVVLRDTPEPSRRVEDEITPGGALINGTWQVKGAYYIAHLGGSVRFNFTEHLALSASGGFACAYVGTTFRAQEELINTDSLSVIELNGELQSNDFTTGYFAGINAEYWITTRTGLYLGMTYEKLGDVEQDRLGRRTAEIELGSGTGFRFGITTKF